MSKSNREAVIVRTYSAGVHFGRLVERNGKEVKLADARRIWSWKGANTLNEIATMGVGKGSRVSVAVESILLLEAIEIILCTSGAAKVLDAAEWNK